ncbi:hypothetical protein ACFXG6_32515 [Streptomyces roseus]|uniref:hypothetical protein n=1 Tax=Streptomyces roseus TaxID=66430 RepID=UPI0036814D33
MDISRADHFRQVLLTAMSGKGLAHGVVVDFQCLSSCDASGLNGHLAARIAARRVVRTAPAPRRRSITRLLKITGVGSLFTIEPIPPV